jgi:hypothetical protein
MCRPALTLFLVFVLMYATTACRGPGRSNPNVGLMLAVAQGSYASGGRVPVMIRNPTRYQIGYISCPRPFERWTGAEWQRAPGDPPDPSDPLGLTDICTSGLPVLLPGGYGSESVPIPRSAAPGTYRLRFYLRIVPDDAAPASEIPKSIVSNWFEVHS